MTAPKLHDQLKLWHLIVTAAISLLGPAVGVYVTHRLALAEVARHETTLQKQGQQLDALDERVNGMERSVLQAQGVTNERLGRLDEKLTAILDRLR